MFVDNSVIKLPECEHDDRFTVFRFLPANVFGCLDNPEGSMTSHRTTFTGSLALNLHLNCKNKNLDLFY